MLTRQMLECLLAGGDDCSLPVCKSRAFQPGGVGKIARCSARSGREARVRFNLHVNSMSFSGHGRSPGGHRRLRGNLGSSTNHQRRGGRCADLCRWCNTFRRSNILPSYRTLCNGQDRAWEPPRKTVPDDGEARQGAIGVERAKLYSRGVRECDEFLCGPPITFCFVSRFFDACGGAC